MILAETDLTQQLPDRRDVTGMTGTMEKTARADCKGSQAEMEATVMTEETATKVTRATKVIAVLPAMTAKILLCRGRMVTREKKGSAGMSQLSGTMSCLRLFSN